MYLAVKRSGRLTLWGARGRPGLPPSPVQYHTAFSLPTSTPAGHPHFQPHHAKSQRIKGTAPHYTHTVLLTLRRAAPALSPSGRSLPDTDCALSQALTPRFYSSFQPLGFKHPLQRPLHGHRPNRPGSLEGREC